MLQYRSLLPGEAVHWSAQAIAPMSGDADDFDYYDQWLDIMNLEPEEESESERGHADLPIEAYRDHLEGLIRRGSAVGVFNGNVCLGLAAAQPLDRTGWWELWECQVRDPYRRHGIGSGLLRRLDEQLANLGGKMLLTGASTEAQGFQRFLTQNGFQTCGMENHEYPLILLQKVLGREL